jgi:hypothetical protein
VRTTDIIRAMPCSDSWLSMAGSDDPSNRVESVSAPSCKPEARAHSAKVWHVNRQNLLKKEFVRESHYPPGTVSMPKRALENPRLFDKASTLWALENAFENISQGRHPLETMNQLLSESGTQSVRPFVLSSSQVLD